MTATTATGRIRQVRRWHGLLRHAKFVDGALRFGSAEFLAIMVAQAHADIPGSQLVLLPGCSHMAQAKWPDLTLCLARGWLADVEAALNG